MNSHCFTVQSISSRSCRAKACHLQLYRRVCCEGLCIQAVTNIWRWFVTAVMDLAQNFVRSSTPRQGKRDVAQRQAIPSIKDQVNDIQRLNAAAKQATNENDFSKVAIICLTSPHLNQVFYHERNSLTSIQLLLAETDAMIYHRSRSRLKVVGFAKWSTNPHLLILKLGLSMFLAKLSAWLPKI